MSVSILLLVGATTAHAQDEARWEHQSEPQSFVLLDYVELWTDSEFDTGWVPVDSPLQVRFEIESTGGAEVEMEGVGHMGWPEGLAVALDPVTDTGEIIVDAALEAVTSIRFDVDIYVWESEIDRRGIDVEGAAFFSPFLLNGDVPDGVEVLFEGDTNELLSWSFQVFTGVSAGISVDLGPEAITTFTGENWYVDGERLDTVGQEAWSEPLGEAYQDVNAEFIGSWTSSLDLVLNPVFEVCVDLAGCWDLVDVDLPIPLASDDFEQFFPTTALMFPLPVMGDLPARHDFGTIEVGSSALLELPIENIGALDLEGVSSIEGDGYFSVYPDYFQAGPARTDGVVVSFTPGAEGDFEGMLVLQSNDPLEPVIEIPVLASARYPTTDNNTGAGANSGNGAQDGQEAGGGSRAQPQIVRTQTGGCNCSTSSQRGGPAGLALLLLGGMALLRRRRTDQA
jgi:MYXO-CTERM domain-containing protein